jgi:hypothetical protein
MEHVRFGGTECLVAWGRYNDSGRPALTLFDQKSGEPMGMVTYNIPELPLADGEFFINHDMIMLGKLPELLATGLCEDTGKKVRLNHVDVHVGRWLVPVCSPGLFKPAVLKKEEP